MQYILKITIPRAFASHRHFGVGPLVRAATYLFQIWNRNRAAFIVTERLYAMDIRITFSNLIYTVLFPLRSNSDGKNVN